MADNCGYMGEAFNVGGRPELLARLQARLELARKVGPEFDSLAFRGVSGAMIAPSLADRLSLGIVAIRKPNDGSHSSAQVEASWGASRYVIVDDLISSGRTCRAIIEAGDEARLTCVGILLYAQPAGGAYDNASRELRSLIINCGQVHPEILFYHEVDRLSPLRFSF
jgi:adenine/guanine phosphoribosyltransferase-like PRPP-binding protein